MSQTNYMLVSLPNEKAPGSEVCNGNLFSSDRKEFNQASRSLVPILGRPYGMALSATSDTQQ